MNAKKEKKLTKKQQRAAWIAQGLCGIDGKAPIWKGHSTAECRKHFLYYKGKAQEYAEAAVANKPTKAAIRRAERLAALRKAKVEAELPADMMTIPISASDIAKDIAASVGRTAYVPPQPRTEMFNRVTAAVGGNETMAKAVMEAIGVQSITTPTTGAAFLTSIEEGVRKGIGRIGFHK